MDEHIERPMLMGELTSAEMQKKMREMTGVEAYSTFLQMVNCATAADVAPVRHGRWVYGEDVDIQCSICGHDAYTEGDYRQVKTSYCPNCGAKMDKE